MKPIKKVIRKSIYQIVNLNVTTYAKSLFLATEVNWKFKTIHPKLNLCHLKVSDGNGDCRQQVLNDHRNRRVDESSVPRKIFFAGLEFVQPFWKDFFQDAIQSDVFGLLLRRLLQNQGTVVVGALSCIAPEKNKMY
jgi:hypothetical protein